MKKNIIIRNSTEDDISAIQAIYDYEVKFGLATFDETARPFEAHFNKRVEVFELGLPHLVAEIDGKVIGYSYAVKYRQERSGYRYCLENSVFIDKDYQRKGVGSLLMDKLIEGCEKGPWRQMIAVIGDSENYGSIGLHAKFGFRKVGTFYAAAFKLGRWVDSVLMQRELGAGDRSLLDDHHS